MKIKEITENRATNTHLGRGGERSQDARLLEKPRKPSRSRTLKDHLSSDLGQHSTGGNWGNSKI